MKKIFALFLGLILLPLAAQATEFKEGSHYKIIKQTATATPEVTEFFSFYCGHCFAFEPFMKNLKSKLPEGVEFKKDHVNFLGGEMGVLLTKAYAAAEILQVEDKFSEIVFNQIHRQRKAINGEKDIIALFEKVGVAREEAENALQSFPVNGLASQMKRNTEKFAIRGVPTVIVNGKYQINRSSLKSEEEFIALVNFLSKKKD